MKKGLFFSILGHAIFIILILFHNSAVKKLVEAEKVYVVDLLSLPSPSEISGVGVSPFKIAQAEASIDDLSRRPIFPVSPSTPKTATTEKRTSEPGISSSFSPDEYMSEIRKKLAQSGSNISSGENVPQELSYPASKKEGSRSLASRIFPLTPGTDSTGISVGFHQSDFQSGGIPSGNIVPLDYLEKIKSTLQKKWKLPEEKNYSLTSLVYFKIKKDGSIFDVQLESSSGVRSFDLSVLKAIKEVEKFDPLPSVYKLDYLEIAVKFNMRGIE